MSHVEDLRDRLRTVIVGTCNTIGCRNCDLKWDEGDREMCSAIELQDKVYRAEHEEFRKSQEKVE